MAPLLVIIQRFQTALCLIVTMASFFWDRLSEIVRQTARGVETRHFVKVNTDLYIYAFPYDAVAFCCSFIAVICRFVCIFCFWFLKCPS